MKQDRAERNITIAEGVQLGKNVTIGDNVRIDFNCIIRDNVKIGEGSYIGAGCILGEHQADFFTGYKGDNPSLVIGRNALIRSGTIIYSGTEIGSHFQTGHRATVREGSQIGEHVSAGTLSDIQGRCRIGNYVRLHSGVFVAPDSRIDDYVWLFPHVILTNDPTPPSEQTLGVHIRSFAAVAAGSIILPGIIVEGDSLVAAGSVVTKDVHAGEVVAGNPARVISHTSQIKNRSTGESVYPWRYYFKRGMPWEESDYDTWRAGFMPEG